jgi:hypothetical protein
MNMDKIDIEIRHAIDAAYVDLLELYGVIVRDEGVSVRLATTIHTKCFLQCIEALADVTNQILSQISVIEIKDLFPTELCFRIILAISNQLQNQNIYSDRSEAEITNCEAIAPKKFEPRENLHLMIEEKKDAVNSKTKRRKVSRCEKIAYEQTDLELAKKWTIFAKAKIDWKDHDELVFAAAICKARRSTNLTSDGMINVFEFIKNDSFWNRVAITPMGLLKKSRNELRKIDNVLNAMKQRMMKGNQVLIAEEKAKYESINEDWNPFDELT